MLFISKVTGRGTANGDYGIIMYAWMLSQRRKFGANECGARVWPKLSPLAQHPQVHYNLYCPSQNGEVSTGQF